MQKDLENLICAVNDDFQKFSRLWEEIWKKADEESNLESHTRYKQEYTKWVMKGGNNNG